MTVAAETRAQIKDLALSGMVASQIAATIGIPRSAVYYVARGEKLFKRGRPLGAQPVKPACMARANRMAEMFRNGCTLARIGQEFCLTRERVRQIIKKHHGIVGKDGGQQVLAAANRLTRNTQRDGYSFAKWGCSFDEWRHLRDLGRTMMADGIGRARTPTGAYQTQRHNAATRGIGWELNLWSWWNIWQRSGKWDARGRGHGFVMCRIRDEGPYAIGNVFIATGVENSSSAPRKKKYDLPIGVSVGSNKYKKFVAHKMVLGVKYRIGSFHTAAEAADAYRDFVVPSSDRRAA